MRNYYTRSTHKLEQGVLNEDAALARRGLVAVSDGAGGGGVFAERWSKYLLKKLPDAAITSFAAFDGWIDGIYEAFYNESEKDAKARGGLFLEKFYDEGSFATLAAAWRTSGNEWQWLTYGDSMVFCYHRSTDVFEYSTMWLTDFDNPPYLISLIDPLQEDGFKHGSFHTGEDAIVFAASDALAHYVLMMYELSQPEVYKDEIAEAIAAKTKNSNFINAALQLKCDFKRVLEALLDRRSDFRWKMKMLERSGLLAHDDYSIAVNLGFKILNAVR